MNNIYKKLQIITTELKNKNLKTDTSVAYGTKKFNYISLEGIYEHLLPLLDKNNCVIYFTCNGTYLTLYFQNTEDEQSREITISIPLITDNELQKDKLKALGSALTYSKRYLLSNLFNIVASEDHEQVTAVNNIKTDNLGLVTDDLIANEPSPTYDIVCKQCHQNTLIMTSKFKNDKGTWWAPCKNCQNQSDPNKKVWTKIN